jgi:hypothetical protein
MVTVVECIGGVGLFAFSVELAYDMRSRRSPWSEPGGFLFLLLLERLALLDLFGQDLDHPFATNLF